MPVVESVSRTSAAKLFGRIIESQYLVLCLSAVYFVCVLPITPSFATPDNLANILVTLLPLFVVAIGQTIVLITGGIDLSVTSIMALASITGATMMNTEHGWMAGSPFAVPVAILAMIAVGALAGLANGIAVDKFKMPPFIVTLTSMMFLSGLAIWLTKSKNIGSLPAAFNVIGGRMFIAFIIASVLGAIGHVMLGRTVWGQWLYAVGHNARASAISGVPVSGVVISAYVASGVFASIAAMLYMGQAESGSPVLAQRLLLDIVGATVIGGTSLFGGRGKVLWTLFGVLFLKLIDNSLNLLDLSYFTIMMVKGAVILFAALMDSARNRLARI
jgi:ribose/xylose/arabinose/galactoside ABC-type transport system permease subunit